LYAAAPRVDLIGMSASSALQSAGRRRNILSAQCSTALNQRQTAAIDQRCEKSRVEK
jgi:hypothetical protein